MIKEEIAGRMLSDLGIDVPFVRGQKTTVHRCWHFSTDGSAVDWMFYDEEDFRNGMNRIYFTVKHFNVAILAFALMDTHVHFILYGEYDNCNSFIHEYVRATSYYISRKHHIGKKFSNLPISHQEIGDDLYLKTAICYVIKNPPVAGLPYTAYDYPWSSGSLYFRKRGNWTSPAWTQDAYFVAGEISGRQKRVIFRSRENLPTGMRHADGIIFPGEYVETEMVERLFRTCKSFNYFMCVSKETDVDSRGGSISMMSIPIQELRKYRDELCHTMFGEKGLSNLDTTKRVKLASALKSRYNSSPRQICKVCGITYEDVKDKYL